MNVRLTSIGLYTGSDLSSTGVVKVGDILSQNSFEIFFAEAFRADFARVDPGVHVDECTDEHSYT